MNLIVAQSGGPTSVINSSLAGVIDSGIDNDFDKIFVSMNGIEGIINENIRLVDAEVFTKENMTKKLKARPASILGSCRFKLDDDLDSPVYEKIFAVLKKNDIGLFVYIGGNDSMDTVKKLNTYIDYKKIERINVIGCPKTIDNDLEGMDHSPGFGSAAKYIASTLRSLRCDVDIYDLESVTFVEIMGRHAGWLAASSLIANYDYPKDLVNLLYIPEDEMSIDELLDDIREALKKEKNLLVAIAEGFRDTGGILSEEVFTNTKDGFNHPIVSGVCQRLADLVRDRLNIKSRAVELNIVQRSNTLISEVDSREAYNLGYRAVEIGIDRTNLVPVLRRKDGETYEVYYTEVAPDEIANREMKIPQEWLVDKKTLQEKILAYALPLIEGEVDQTYENGMPVFVKIEDFTREI
ncbi:diphosphate--fructose-6-phosphate 1-phosphotransferase [Anaerococcus degeneri]|uniref:Pyrophosphate--fructose 6-phosphate 1-phosphotransferase n=1 Tax=Anaerococcus degeneri TaxID=361500 RepID=A0ABS7YYB8_9FIRM|nr:diphosphate--fructose-6-phosphate 1-phosphotransferase [Anaerococcus degeneri]MBP2016164.1 6-phosphofructokinase 1 [Anaerococcus degeneri]MCA2096633.1 diphosphate--fructose-6-phosphate 1-phosphotransferase [Anaerococcus degeneri]